MGATSARIIDGVRRRLRYSGVRAEPGVTLRELEIAGERLLLGDLDESIAILVVANEIGHGAYDFGDLDLRPGDVVIDIGAHVGIVSIFLAKRFPGVRVLAFEPMPRTFAVLQANLRRNGVRTVTAFNMAVTGDGADIEIISHPSSTGGSTSYYSTLDVGGHDRITVPSTTLDEILERNAVERCALLKIDVEGAEYDVLYNSSLLGRVEHIRGEFHENEYIRSLGYSMEKLGEYCGTVIGPDRTKYDPHYLQDA